jgi:hypothetical protein
MSALTVPAPALPIAPAPADIAEQPSERAVNCLHGVGVSSGWNLNERRAVVVVQREEQLSEFHWNEDVYQARLKAKAFFNE